MDRFPEKRAFITGAGSGLGRALCLELAARGWRVGVAEIDPERSRETVDLVNRAGGQPLEILCDVTRVQEVEKAAQRIKKEWDGVDIVVNNVGVSGGGYMEEIPLERWEWIMDLNMRSTIYGCRSFIPILAQQGHGYIINVASYLGYISAPESSCYNLTKAGVISLSETLKTELAPKGIGVSVVMPSFFKTNLMDQLYTAGERQDKLIRGLFEKTSFPPERVARYIFKSVRKNRLYIIPQWDARLLWRFKRYFPETYFKLFSFIYRQGAVERIFGLDL